MRKTFSPSNEAKQRKIQAASIYNDEFVPTDRAQIISDELLDFIAKMPDNVRDYFGEDDIATMGEVVDMLQDYVQAALDELDNRD